MATIQVALVDTTAAQRFLRDQAVEFARISPGDEAEVTLVASGDFGSTIRDAVSAQTGAFDVVVATSFEIPLWARSGLLTSFDAALAEQPDYDLDDFFEVHRTELSVDGQLVGLPFQGGSAVTMYRADVLWNAGVVMPAAPTWDQISDLARVLHHPEQGQFGICLRGVGGWTQNMTTLTTFFNAFGGRWFDENWTAQLTSEPVKAAFGFYADLIRRAAIPDSDEAGLSQCLAYLSSARAAIWYDASSALDVLLNPGRSYVSEQLAVAKPPVSAGATNWHWLWAFAVPATSAHQSVAQRFATWATSKTYLDFTLDRAAPRLAPIGARRSSFGNSRVSALLGLNGPVLVDAIEELTPQTPTVEAVPYQGGQFVRIPEYPALGDAVGKELAAVLAGGKGMEEALKTANELANQTAINGGYQR